MKHHIVTGAASGIGRAVLDLLLAQGDRVTAIDLSELPGTDTVEFCRADVASPAEVAAAVERGRARFGPPAGVVANAGIALPGTIDTLSQDDWDRVIAVNLTSVFVLAKATIPLLREHGGGSFVAVASQHGLVGDPGNAAYCAAKAGVINFVRCLAIDHAAAGVRANAVCPGPIDTPMMQRGLTDDAERARVTGRVPMHRLGTPTEAAAAVVFLLSDAASYITGSPLVVDGGYVAQ